MAFRPFSFLLLWTGMAASFTYLGLNLLSSAREKGRFDYLWHDIGVETSPLVFNALKGLLAVWTGLAFLMTLVGCTWLAWTIIGALMKAFGLRRLKGVGGAGQR